LPRIWRRGATGGGSNAFRFTAEALVRRLPPPALRSRPLCKSRKVAVRYPPRGSALLRWPGAKRAEPSTGPKPRWSHADQGPSLPAVMPLGRPLAAEHMLAYEIKTSDHLSRDGGDKSQGRTCAVAISCTGRVDGGGCSRTLPPSAFGRWGAKPRAQGDQTRGLQRARNGLVSAPRSLTTAMFRLGRPADLATSPSWPLR
jgi:hypothetical protein